RYRTQTGRMVNSVLKMNSSTKSCLLTMRNKTRNLRRRAPRVARPAKAAQAKENGRTQPSPSRLLVYVAGQILALIRKNGMKAGQPLREEALAYCLDVSRTSVRGALHILGSQNVVEGRPHRGYLLRRNANELEEGIELPPTSDERLYLQIARDYLSGVL